MTLGYVELKMIAPICSLWDALATAIIARTGS